MNDERTEENDEFTRRVAVDKKAKGDVPASGHKIEMPAVKEPAPEPVDLQALAATVRTALKNGHPDATKHLDALLTELGA